mgnify:CR=1 FL=1
MRDMGLETVCGGGFCSVEETVPRRGLCRENMDGRRCR